MKTWCLFIAGLFSMLMTTGCASSNERQPAGYNRSGREYKEARPMNHRRLDSETLYRACLRERPESSCRNRMGR
ncbi:MAG: hypothetical protein MJK18_00140 [Bdellovibrionales bacterium]|nr:hypothetical protein [Bdellovibrionales bacterium]